MQNVFRKKLRMFATFHKSRASNSENELFLNTPDFADAKEE